MTAVAERQLGPPASRLPGAPAPHCRHQSWAPSSGEPQLAQTRCDAAGVGWSGSGAEPCGAAPGAAGDGCSGAASTRGSASNVVTGCYVYHAQRLPGRRWTAGDDLAAGRGQLLVELELPVVAGEG